MKIVAADKHAACCGSGEKLSHDTSQCRECSFCKLAPTGASIVVQVTEPMGKLVVDHAIVRAAHDPTDAPLDPPVPPPPLITM